MASTTPRLGMTLPDPADTVDIVVLNNDLLKVDNTVGATPCTSTTRPSAPVDGQIIREHDTGNMYVWDATSNIWATVTSSVTSSSASQAINVKDAPYRAAGNGTTDDTAAIQAALTAAGAAGGGIVFLPEGTYQVNKYLLIPSGVTLAGAGMGVSTIKAGITLRTGGGVAPDGGGYSILQATGGSRSNIAIQDLTVDGNESVDRTALAASPVRSDSYLIDMRNVTGLRIERVATRNSWTYNIMVHTCTKFVVAGCDVRDAGTTGVYDQLDGIHILGSNGGRILGNYVDNGNGGDADDAMVAHVISGGSSCFDLVYANNVCRGGTNGNGMQIAGDAVAIRDITIQGNVFWGCSNGGIFTNFYAVSGNQPIRSITITGNTVRDSVNACNPIWVHVSADGFWQEISITGNVVDGYGNLANPAAFGICVEGNANSRGVTISGNVLRNGYSRGIYLAEGAPVRDYVIANNIIDCTAATNDPLAIILGQSLDGITTGNVATGRSTSNGVGIYVDSTASFQATNQIITGNRVRAFNVGIQVTNAAGNNPTNTIVTSNITQGNATGTSFGTATVTSANNL